MNTTADTDTSVANAAALQRELEWCGRVFDARFDHHFSAAGSAPDRLDLTAQVPPPDLSLDSSTFARQLRDWSLGYEERVVLALALMPHLRPQMLDLFFLQNATLNRPYTEFGGVPGKHHTGFLPTCETAAFVLAGRDLERRLAVMGLFGDTGTLRRHDLLRLDSVAAGEPFWGAALRVTNDALSILTTGRTQKPDYASDFPAKLLTTGLSWQDLVLPPQVMEEVALLNDWMRSSQEIIEAWGIRKLIKPGYRCLFYGPPGTGKTLTASLIGAHAGVDVYRIDLSMVVSKYIGETEKNLANVFDQAQNKNWVLFFDEADALFGKRTQGSSSNDRHANQEISYLLQRVEDFPGMVILASNLKSNIDEAFSRRFQSAIYFPVPDADQRLRLWEGLFPDPSRLDPGVDLAALAEKYELAGGVLINVVRHAVMRAHRANRSRILQADLLAGLSRELLKEGRTL